MRIYNAVIGGEDFKGRWQVYEYLIRAEDEDEALGAFGSDCWSHGLGDTALRDVGALPELSLAKGTEVEFPASHNIVCVSHPDIHVGWSNYIAIPHPYPGCGVRTKNGRLEVKFSFGRHTADTCWTATEEQTRKIENELDPHRMWACFFGSPGRMNRRSLEQFGLLPGVAGD